MDFGERIGHVVGHEYLRRRFSMSRRKFMVFVLESMFRICEWKAKLITFIRLMITQFARWVYIGVFDMLIEMALVLTSLWLIWGRQMALSSKLTVSGVFACRLP